MARLEELRSNLAAVRRSVGDRVEILPVTKFHPASDLELLYELGVRAVGENREQEAREKAAACPQMDVWMIGQIQSKKCNSIARWAAGVQSVDSLKIVHGLERGMRNAQGTRTKGDTLPCYIQLSFDGDPDRGGCSEDNLGELVAAIRESEHLKLVGFMVVPPLGTDATEVFRWAHALCQEYSTEEPLKLSAGMSGDMHEAIAAGSDVVRVGTAILGSRPVA